MNSRALIDIASGFREKQKRSTPVRPVTRHQQAVVARTDRWPDSSLATTRGSSSEPRLNCRNGEGPDLPQSGNRLLATPLDVA